MPATAQLTVRLSERLRQAVKRRAAEEGTTVQAFVEQTLREAVQPEATLSAAAADELLTFIRSGAYTDVSRSIAQADPDLATV